MTSRFSKGEPFASLLLMLFDYLTPEEHEVPETRAFLKEIRAHLKDMILGQLLRTSGAENVEVFLGYMVPDPDKFNQLRDVFDILKEYHSRVAKLQRPSIFEDSVYKNLAGTGHRSSRRGFVTALFLIIHTAVSHKHQLNAVISETPETVETQLGCMEDLLASAVDVLLSLHYPRMYEKSLETLTVKYALNPVAPVATPHKKTTDEKIVGLLKPTGGTKTTEEIVLFYLFLRPNYIRKHARPAYEKNYLGENSYHILTKRIFFKSSTETSLAESEINPGYSVGLYKAMIQNVGAFEFPVRQSVFTDMKKLLTNPGFFEAVLKVEEIGVGLSRYLSKPKYCLDDGMRKTIHELVILYLIQGWSRKTSKATIGAIFDNLLKATPEVFAEFSKDLLHRLFYHPPSEDATHGYLQLAHVFEDFATSHSSVTSDPMFAELVVTMMLVLDRVGMGYFWYPSFGSATFLHNYGAITGTAEYDPKCTQREGGVLRIILRLLFATVLKIDEDAIESKLVIRALDWYVFRDKSALAELMRAAESIKGFPTEMLPKMETLVGTGPNLMLFSLQANKKLVGAIKPKVKAIWGEKSVAQQKVVEDLFDPTKDVYESASYKLLMLTTYLSQVIIYRSLGIASYKEISFFALESAKPSLSALSPTTRELFVTLGRIINEYGLPAAIGGEIDKRASRIGRLAIKNCFSDIDMLPKGFVEHSEPGTPFIKEHIGQSKGYVDYMFDCSPPGSESTYTSADQSSGVVQFKEDLMKALKEISEEYGSYRDKASSIENYLTAAAQILLSPTHIKVIQAGLHEMITEDYKCIDKAIFIHLHHQRTRHHSSNESDKIAPRLDEIKTALVTCSKKLHSEKSTEKTSTVTKRPENWQERYEELRGKVFAEKPFVDNKGECKRNKEAYQLVAEHYGKLLARCPLNQIMEKKKCYSDGSHIKTFVKLDPHRDNLDRAMRLKPMKAPLQSLSILKGISYMRHFFLKRVMIASVLSDLDPAAGDDLVFSGKFLVSSRAMEAVLTPLLSNVNRKVRLGTIYRFMSSPKITQHLNLNELVPPPKVVPDQSASQICVSRSQIFVEGRDAPKQRPTFEGEIIKVDTSHFGVFCVSKQGIHYEKRTKDADKGKYRLGCSKEMSCCEPSSRNAKKTWKFGEISKIVLRRHNLIRQALEIFLVSHKSVFILLFSETNLGSFCTVLKNKLDKHKWTHIHLVDDPRMELELQKSIQDWRKRKQTTFGYLMKLNFCGGRSFQDLSQYPVFPWVVQDYHSTGLEWNSKNTYRDFRYPMAGINEHKRLEAVRKYENTNDFPGGPFQYGAHYLPGRAVLGYLMRLQPFTHMIYKFDSGGDCPARHFHNIEKTWGNIQKECDMNLELIPEFYYLPEFLDNLNCLSFGAKQMDDNFGGLKNQLVRVDSVILPPWARNNHHYVFMNYMALERNWTRENVSHWIDLMFGYKQQKGGEFYNLFKPLTSEAVFFDVQIFVNQIQTVFNRNM